MRVTLDLFQELGGAVEGPDALRLALFNWKFKRPSYEVWSALVEEAVAYEVGRISLRKADLQDLGEDGITAVLTIALEAIGLIALSARINGNCDVTVSYNNEYLWIAEAKIFTGVAHVWGGYLQLTSRYASGMPDHNRGGMLLYCLKGSADVLLEEWRASLAAQVADSNARESPFPLSFLSSAGTASTGLFMQLTHFAFPLHHDPMEDKLKMSSEAFAAGREAKKIAKAG